MRTRAGMSLRLAATLGLLLAIIGPVVWAAPAAGFTVLDIGERSLDDAPALAVLFSEPLRTNQRYDAYITVTNDKGAVVNG
ncbi:MAG: hypothetical protein OEV31_04615, partial [Gammaproteobacteria bacterium]|nr:hypothetical protein [Gammaproteobacteria bacterium]